MTAHQLRAALAESVRNVRSKLPSFLVTLLMVSLSFMVFDIFMLVSWNLGSVLRTEQERVGIEVFLEDGVTHTEAVVLGDRIAGMDGVRSVYYVSSEEAEALFRADLPEQADMMTLLGTSFRLPASIQVSLHPDYRTSERVGSMARTLAGFQGVEDVIYGEEYLPGLTRAVSVLGRLVLLAGLVLAVSLSLVVANTVRLAVSRRARTVEIMSIVGAPGWFVRLPFVGEGMLLGTAGAAGSLVLTRAVSAALAGSVEHSFLPGRWVLSVLALGLLAGWLGSWLGMRTGIPGPRGGR